MGTLILFSAIAAVYFLCGIGYYLLTKKVVQKKDSDILLPGTLEDHVWFGVCLFLWPLSGILLFVIKFCTDCIKWVKHER